MDGKHYWTDEGTFKVLPGVTGGVVEKTIPTTAEKKTE